MSFRTLRERIVQSLAFEAGGLLLAAPIYAILFDRAASQSIFLIVALSAAMVMWMPLHNILFDWVEWRTAERVASSRPHRLRVLHAVSLEVSGVIITVPLVILIGQHALVEAVAIDLGLSAFYVAYGYAFHLIFDRLRPVEPRFHAGGDR
ncbi:MAG: PACE efflux transporter [Pseudomonadota bacterium]